MRSNNNEYKTIADLWNECSKRDLLNDPPTITALQQLRIDPYNQNCLKFVHMRINAYDKIELLNPDTFRKTNPQQKDNILGSIHLGIIRHTKASWGLSLEDMTVHICVVGRNGGGKTTVIKHLLEYLLERESRDSHI